MRVSVILPIYNVEPYLRRCLDSLINQTMTEIEIICVNDASPDNSLQILKEYAEKDSRIKIIDLKHNMGAAGARQSGLDIANGEYVGFVDPDDYVNTDFFEKLYESAKKENADISKGAVITVDLSGNETITSNKQNNQIRQNKFNFHGQNLWDAIYRTEMIREHNIHFEIDIFCFGLPATFWANKIVVRDDAFYKYIRREDSCDSQIFSVYKWQHWNVRGARYYLKILNSLDYPLRTYVDICAQFIFPLYFWGYDRLSKFDRLKSTSDMADCLIEFGTLLKYKDLFKNKLTDYGPAILSVNKHKLERLLKYRYVKSKLIKKILVKFC